MKNARLGVSVYKYCDYRAYLDDCYKSYKAADTGFSYRSFSARAGLTSPSALREVITGKIGITRNSLPKYVRGLGLNRSETEYFRALVAFGQAKSDQARQEAYLDMLSLRRRTHTVTLQDAQFEYCNEWYYSVIRSLAGTGGFRNDPEWIAQVVRPAITPGRARKAVELLLRLGLLKEAEDGRLVQADAHIDIDPETDRLAVRHLNRSMIRQAGAAVADVGPDNREISHATIGLSRTAYRRLQARIRAFKAEVLNEIAESGEPADMVCQMNVQLFPFTVANDDTDNSRSNN